MQRTTEITYRKVLDEQHSQNYFLEEGKDRRLVPDTLIEEVKKHLSEIESHNPPALKITVTFEEQN